MSSPNMGLTIPVPTVTEGPQYAQEIQQNFNLIDSHNHTSGQGSLIPLNALTISQNLDMNSYSVTNLKSTALVNQLSAPAENGSVYMTGDNLYWKDGTGSFNVQITNGNSLAGAAGTISGLPTGTASAAYLSGSGTFRFQSATNVGADVDCRTVTLRNNVVSSFGMQVLPPTLAANLQVTLPLPPASTKIIAMSSAGAMAANIDADNSSIEIVTNNLQVKDNGITTAKILNGAVTNAKLGALGQQTSAVSGTFTTSSILFSLITNQTVTITTTGRPVMIMFQAGTLQITGTGGLVTDRAEIEIVRGGSTQVGFGTFGISNIRIPATSIIAIDPVSAGTHTYTAEARVVNAATTLSVIGVNLIVFEL
jgi:hypothetical protein